LKLRAVARFMATMDRLFQSAWQPLTPWGVARFADGTTGRLWVVQFVFALFAAAAVTWFVRAAWFPTVEEAIGKLPATGEIRAGQLYWQADSPLKLAEGRFLSLSVDLAHSGAMRGASHVRVEFGRGSLAVCALFGRLDLPYPTDFVFGLNQVEAKPWWGAWRPAILAEVFVGTLAGLMITWGILATVYCLPAWLVGVLANRPLPLGGAWRLCGAALMPGALFLSLAVVFYGLGFLDPVRLVVAFVAHVLVGWIYVGVSPAMRERPPEAQASNPFAGGGKPAQEGAEDPFAKR
jgi:hypothetical protein